jgi:hypothetical protein
LLVESLLVFQNLNCYKLLFFVVKCSDHYSKRAFS